MSRCGEAHRAAHGHWEDRSLLSSQEEGTQHIVGPHSRHRGQAGGRGKEGGVGKSLSVVPSGKERVRQGEQASYRLV